MDPFIKVHFCGNKSILWAPSPSDANLSVDETSVDETSVNVTSASEPATRRPSTLKSGPVSVDNTKVMMMTGNLDSQMSNATSGLSDPPPTSPLSPFSDPPPSPSPPPVSQTSSLSSETPFPSTDLELRERFITNIQSRLQLLGDGPDADFRSSTERRANASEFLALRGLISVLHDPTSSLIATDLERVKGHMVINEHDELDVTLDLLRRRYHHDLISIQEYWKSERTGNNVSGGAVTQGAKRRKTGDSRPNSDTAAQERVREYYNNTCILTGGTEIVEGAHIVDLKVLTKVDKEIGEIWTLLRGFWSLPRLNSLQVGKKERENILPLRVDAHRFWDSHLFALRPIEHPTDPTHRIYLQYVWIWDISTRGSLVAGNWDGSKGFIADFRRRNGFNLPALQHGDVYEIVTENPETRPLPNYQFLQFRFAAQKILAGMKAQGALKNIFDKGPPPGDFMSPAPAVPMPKIWEMALEAAIDQQIITEETATIWRLAILQDVYQRWEGLFAERPARDPSEDTGREGRTESDA